MPIPLKESETCELKPSLSQLDDSLKTVCGFLNHKGGIVYFGINDAGEPTGIDVSEPSLRKISQQISSRIRPEVFPVIRAVEIDGRHAIIVDVPEGRNKPYFLNGIAYKRVGVEKRIMPPDELKEMLLAQTEPQWGGRICAGAGIEDIDFEFIEKSFMPEYERTHSKAIHGGSMELLRSLDCLKDGKPTNVGILLFGKEPQKFFINSYIAVARYPDVVESPLRLDYKEFSGNLFRQIDDAVSYILEHMAVMSRLEPGKVQREDIPEYGPYSVRELVTNAVCHRSYISQGSKVIIKMFTDRIEFYNPASVPESLNASNIASYQYSRNPAIITALSMIKYVEHLGEGWNKIMAEHRKHPLKPKMPVVDGCSLYFIATLYSSKSGFPGEGWENETARVAEKVTEKVTENQRKIMANMLNNKAITVVELVKIVGISRKNILSNISKLKEKGLLKRVGADKGGHWEVTEKAAFVS